MNDFPDLPDASAILGHDDLWIGAMPTTTELTHLALTRDVRTVVACCRHVSYSANAVSGVFWLPMDDGPTAPRRPIVSAVLRSVEAMREASGGGVLFHCEAGLNRSAFMAASFLCERRGLVAEDAIRLVRASRGTSAVLFNNAFVAALTQRYGGER